MIIGTLHLIRPMTAVRFPFSLSQDRYNALMHRASRRYRTEKAREVWCPRHGEHYAVRNGRAMLTITR